MYENDPDRLNQPRVGDPVRDPVIQRGATPVFMTVALLAAAVIAFALFFWPSDRAPTVTKPRRVCNAPHRHAAHVRQPTEPRTTTPAPPQ